MSQMSCLEKDIIVTQRSCLEQDLLVRKDEDTANSSKRSHTRGQAKILMKHGNNEIPSTRKYFFTGGQSTETAGCWTFLRHRALFPTPVFNMCIYSFIYIVVVCLPIKDRHFNNILEDTARYAGLLLPPAEGFGQGFFALPVRGEL